MFSILESLCEAAGNGLAWSWYIYSHGCYDSFVIPLAEELVLLLCVQNPSEVLLENRC